MFEIVAYIVAVSLYGTFEAKQLRPGDFSSARTFIIIEEKAVRIRTGVTELPDVAVTASPCDPRFSRGPRQSEDSRCT